MAAAAELASQLLAGDVIALCGGLGAGKTHFTKGLAVGLGLRDSVSSPTFSLVQEYDDPEARLRLFHFDFYRMEKAQEALNLGWDDYLDAGGVCVVEWADLFPSLFPEHTRWYRLEAPQPDVRTLCRISRPE